MFKIFKKKKKIIVEEYSKEGGVLTEYEISLLERKESICPNCKNIDFTTIDSPYDSTTFLGGKTYHCQNCGMMYNIWDDNFMTDSIRLRIKNYGYKNKYLDKKLSRKKKINILINKIKDDE